MDAGVRAAVARVQAWHRQQDARRRFALMAATAPPTPQTAPRSPLDTDNAAAVRAMAAAPMRSAGADAAR